MSTPATDEPSPLSPAVSEQSVLRPVACRRCRQRRSFCSKEKPQCSRCRDGAYECIYEEARKITINESYLRELEAKVKAYEAPRRKALPGPGSSAAQSRTVVANYSGEDEDELEDGHRLLEPFRDLKIDQPGRPYIFKGPGSSDQFLESFRKLSGFYSDNGSLDLQSGFYDPNAVPSRRQSHHSHVHFRLPPIDIARRLFAAQYTYIGTIFFFTDPETFEQLLLEAYQGPPDSGDKEACLAYAKVLMILAFGQLYSINQWIDFKGPPGFDYFTRALELLPDAHEEGSILCVETLAYVGYFMQNMNRRDAAFLYIGMALRMAISLGLHQEVSVPGLDETSKEHRRRVWWSIYSLDRILCVKSGNPITISDEDIGVARPSRLPSEPAYCPAVVLRHYTELSTILAEVNRRIYRRVPGIDKSGSRLIESVQSIRKSLNTWHANIPEELRFDPAKLAVTRESVSTFLHYYQCINMTARPLLFHVVQKRLRADPSDPSRLADWKAGLSQTTVSVVEGCIAAAQETIHMMSIAAQRDLVATYGYMDGEHLFSASIVLVMVCGAFPANQQNCAAMATGLELLHAMSLKGNSYMGARYELLVHLRDVLMPGDKGCRAGVPGGYNAMLPLPQAQPSQDIDGGVVASSASAQPQPQAQPPQQLVTRSFIANTGLPGTMMLGPVPTPTPTMNVGGGDLMAGIGSFGSMGDVFYDGSISSVMGDDDFRLWEEGFADPAGYDLSQWTQAAQMAVDHEMN